MYPDPPFPAKSQCALQLRGSGQDPLFLSLSYFYLISIGVLPLLMNILFRWDPLLGRSCFWSQLFSFLKEFTNSEETETFLSLFAGFSTNNVLHAEEDKVTGLTLPESHLCHQGRGWPCQFVRYNIYNQLIMSSLMTAITFIRVIYDPYEEGEGAGEGYV